MKKIIAFIFSIVNLFASAQPGLLWAKQIGGTSTDIANAIAVDAYGSVLVTGSFNGTVDFDPGAGTFTLTAPPNGATFVMKLDVSGNFVWAKQISGDAYNSGQSIKVDASGNVYTTGYFSGTSDFDPGAPIFNLVAAGSGTVSYDIFILKLDPTGNFIWAKSIGGTQDDIGYSITLDQIGNIYTTGEYRSGVDFDPGPGTFSINSSGGLEAFILKLDPMGNFLLAKSMGGALDDIGYSLKVDASGNIITTGYFQGTADFDPGPGTFTLSPGGFGDIFVSKLDASGNFMWAKNSGGSSVDEGWSVDVDASGNIYSTGSFQGTSDFDPNAGTFTITSIGNSDMFIWKLDPNGNFVWAKDIGGTSGSSNGTSISVDASGSVYTTGYFTKTADFNPGIGVFNLVSGGLYDICISKLDASGNFIWAQSTGGISNDLSNSVVLDASLNVLIAGSFQGTVDFDPSINVFNLVSAGGQDIFVQKIGQPVGIKENNNSNIFNIYLNPNNGLFSAKLNANSQLIITNVLGQEILNENLSIGKHNLDIQDQANGLYFVKVIDENKNTETQKIIKQ